MGTFSTNLLLSLLAFGESAANGFDNWGESANFNFGRLDSKLGSKSTSSLAAGDVTLSANAESSLFLQFTGTLSDDTVVNVSARPGFWLMSNETTGDYTVTLLPSGGTGTVIPAGTSLMYSDGDEPVVIQSGGTGDGSEVIYEANNLTLNNSGTIVIPGIPNDARDVRIEAELAGLTANSGIVALNIEIGNGSTWAASKPVLIRWTSSQTTGRRFVATISNIDDAALSVLVSSDNSAEDRWREFITPASYSSRPLASMRLSLTPVPSVTTTLTILRIRVTAIRG